MQRDLICSDCLDAVRDGMIDKVSVDLIYLDPPFNSKQVYNLPFVKLGKESKAVEAFNDIWHWDDTTIELYEELKAPETIKLREFIDAVKVLRGGEDSITAYLVNMAIRLHELRKVLKNDGSIYLHCDPAAVHYLKVLMDSIYGEKCFRREIIWSNEDNSGFKSQANNWIRGHDNILFYVKDPDNFYFHKQYTPLSESTIKRYDKVEPETGKRYKIYNEGGVERRSYLKEDRGVGMSSVWTDIQSFQTENNTGEYLGYPTQKKQELLERILISSSEPGDLIFDPFCGCGTTLHASENLNRDWVGCDICRFSVGVVKNRLLGSFGTIHNSIRYRGVPTDKASALELAAQNPWEFEKWACGQIGARGLYKNPGDKGADGGIDGVIEFVHKKDKKSVSFAVVQVKGGAVKPNDVKALYADVEDEPKATAGVFICFEKYRKTFENNASHRKITSEINNKKFPMIQLVTVEEMLDGKEPDLPNPIFRQSYTSVSQTKDMGL